MPLRVHFAVVLLALPACALAQAALTARSAADCDMLVRDAPQSLDSYRCFSAIAHRDGSFEAARQHLDALLRHDPSNHRALFVLAMTDANQGRDTAAGRYQRSADLAHAARDRATEVSARVFLSILFIRRQRLDDADQQLARARTAASESTPILTATVDVARANLAYARRDFAGATILLKDTEPRIFPEGPLELRSRWLGTMGATAWAAGRTNESLSLYTRQTELLAAAGNRFEEARARANLVLLAASFNRPREERLKMALAALAAASDARNIEIEGAACFYVAELTSGREALSYASRGLEIARKQRDFNNTMLGLRATASLMVEFDRSGAFRLIDEAIDLARQRGDLAGLARNRVVRSRMAWKVGPRAQAIADSIASLDAIESERNLQADTMVRAFRFSSWSAVYSTLAGHLLAGDLLTGAARQPSPADLDVAFHTIERMRSRSLLDAMDAAQVTPALAANDPVQTRRIALLAQVAEVRRRLLDPTLGQEERHVATVEFEALQRNEIENRTAVAAADPAFATLHTPRLATFEDVDRVIASDQALLSFQLSNDRTADGTFLGGSWLIVRTRGTSAIYRLPGRDQVESEVQLFLGLLARRDGSEAVGATRLYRDLLEQALADLPPQITRLVIVPGGILNALPFDALRGRREGPPLADRFEISMAPSATVWVRWKAPASASTPGPALVLADPDLSSTASKPDALPRLVRARTEGRDVARVLGSRTELRVGSLANEYDLKHRDLSGFAILHFATHALVDDEHPDRSALLLAAGSPTEDGWLRPREVVVLHLHGQLVVLSACLTASGSLVGGEGVMGLAHAFFQADAHAVIGGLWPLKDDEAAELVEAFYRHLSQGERIAAALTAARREGIRAGMPAAGWAAFTLIGDGDFSPAPRLRSSPRPVGLILLALAAVLGTAVLFIRFGRRGVSRS